MSFYNYAQLLNTRKFCRTFCIVSPHNTKNTTKPSWSFRFNTPNEPLLFFNVRLLKCVQRSAASQARTLFLGGWLYPCSNVRGMRKDRYQSRSGVGWPGEWHGEAERPVPRSSKGLAVPGVGDEVWWPRKRAGTLMERSLNACFAAAHIGRLFREAGWSLPRSTRLARRCSGREVKWYDQGIDRIKKKVTYGLMRMSARFIECVGMPCQNLSARR